VGSRTSFACVESRARRDVNGNARTNAAAAGGVRAAVGGIESLRATPVPRQSEEEVERLTAELAEVTTERDDYAATVDEFILR
jgi:selenocysteine lyase/cysteine desulfurase